MAIDFKIGDVVELNSGGPKMTIVNIVGCDEARKAVCRWSVNDGLQCNGFSVECIKLYQENKNDDSRTQKNAQ